MPAIYHEGSWLGNATDPEVLVKDTVGWTGKNRAYSQTNNAVIAHIENGITYDVSWTGSATVTLKKNSTSGATITSGSTSPLSFTADADYELYFGSSATVTNIMVKDSRITDSTYEPYHESVQNQLNAQGVLGVRQFISYPYSQGLAYTVAGITFTADSDGVVNVNGTKSTDASSNVSYALMSDDESLNKFIGKKFTLTGGVDDKVSMFVAIRHADSTPTTYILDEGNGIDFKIPSTIRNIAVNVLVRGDHTVVSNVKVYPMIRLASDPDDTYQPYAMTNRELTEKSLLKPFNNIISNVDLDNIISSGCYVLGGNITHGAGNYGILIVFTTSTANTQVRQIFMNVTEDAFFTRHKNDGTWSSWYKFTGTVVS